MHSLRAANEYLKKTKKNPQTIHNLNFRPNINLSHFGPKTKLEQIFTLFIFSRSSVCKMYTALGALSPDVPGCIKIQFGFINNGDRGVMVEKNFNNGKKSGALRLGMEFHAQCDSDISYFVNLVRKTQSGTKTQIDTTGFQERISV